jgi:glycosyltransferase involved in cell wall biosynthesis
VWNGQREAAVLKFAPFLFPPFRVLIMNEHRGFFNASPRLVFCHVRVRTRSRVWDAAQRVRDQAVIAGYRLLLAWGWLLAWSHRIYWAAFHFLAKCGPLLSTLRFRIRGFAFLLVAALAQRSAPLARMLLSGHGNKRFPVSSHPSAGDGMVCFEYGPLDPDWDKLERLAKFTQCRWILLREKNTPFETISDMLPLFQDSRTFAVSRQAGLRPWKPRLLPQAPFRALQPGEACQVLTPVSPCILVDRGKLLELGVPRACYSGTAWLLMFWKAAAAGLRSYSVGGGAPLKPFPFWPVQESEFLVRLLEDSAQRALCPAEPELSRGSISFAIGGSRRLRDRPRVLIVSPYLPFPMTHGGAVRIYHLCRALSDRVDFLLATFIERGDHIDYETLHEIFREVYVVDREEDPSGDRALPVQVRQYRSRSMSALIRRLCRERRPDLLQVEYAHMAGFRTAALDVPSLLVEHDLTFSLYRQLAERTLLPFASREHRKWLRFEQMCFESFNALWVMSELDQVDAVAAGASIERTSVVPNGVDITRFCPRGVPSPFPEILFVGSFRHLPNLIGFETLMAEVMPRVWDRVPAAKLTVVAGPDPDRYRREFHKGHNPPMLESRVQLHGFVLDVAPHYEQAWMVVAPLEVSAGTNIKILEALACGKAIVASPVAVHGLTLRDGRDVLIRANWSQFAAAVVAVLVDSEMRQRIGAEARCTAERHYDWRAIAERAYQSYVRVAPHGLRGGFVFDSASRFTIDSRSY